jgi:hypothetical protein
MDALNARRYDEQTMKGLFRKIYPVIAQQILARTGVRTGLCMDHGIDGEVECGDEGTWIIFRKPLFQP